MARLHLVRHGHAAAGWGDEPDPGLDDRGRAEASAVGASLAGALTVRRLVSSPKARAQETAGPLARTWAAPVEVDPAYGEIPSPEGDVASRKAWLSSALASRWDDLGPDVDRWRAALLAAVRATEVDTVAFTHFVAINAVVAAATADDAVTVFLPANASVTELEVDAATATVRVVSLGSEAPPEVG